MQVPFLSKNIFYLPVSNDKLQLVMTT